MKTQHLISCLLFTLSACAQPKLSDHLKNLEGIWIAENYLQAFDKNRSSLASIGAFDPDYPAGLRVNSRELENDSLTIGYGVLHDHSIYPEISAFVLNNGERVSEQGFIKINALKPDSLNFYQISDTHYFNYECVAYFSWQYGKDTTLVLYRPASAKLPEMCIRYKRIAAKIAPDNPFPNPIYYYTRSKMLVGDFLLKDGNGKILSERVSIGLDGRMKGYAPFDSLRCYYSTEVYCGPHESKDVVLTCSMDKNYDFKCEGYYYQSLNDGSFQFLDRTWIEDDDEYQIGGVKFAFVRL